MAASIGMTFAEKHKTGSLVRMTAEEIANEKKLAGSWRSATIPISLESEGDNMIAAIVKGPFAINARPNDIQDDDPEDDDERGWFNLTHRPTGLRMARFPHTQAAQVAADLILPIRDWWSLSIDAPLGALSDIRDRVRNIVIDNGGHFSS